MVFRKRSASPGRAFSLIITVAFLVSFAGISLLAAKAFAFPSSQLKISSSGTDSVQDAEMFYSQFASEAAANINCSTRAKTSPFQGSLLKNSCKRVRTGCSTELEDRNVAPTCWRSPTGVLPTVVLQDRKSESLPRQNRLNALHSTNLVAITPLPLYILTHAEGSGINPAM